MFQSVVLKTKTRARKEAEGLPAHSPTRPATRSRRRGQRPGLCVRRRPSSSSCGEAGTRAAGNGEAPGSSGELKGLVVGASRVQDGTRTVGSGGGANAQSTRRGLGVAAKPPGRRRDRAVRQRCSGHRCRGAGRGALTELGRGRKPARWLRGPSSEPVPPTRAWAAARHRTKRGKGFLLTDELRGRIRSLTFPATVSPREH